jgi:hypothetical protein
MERLPTAPTPEARANGNKPNMKANEVIKIDVNELALLLLPLLSNPFRCVAFVWQIDDQNGILGEQPDKHDQSDLK